MTRGRKPIAAEIKELTGSYRKDPQRKNHDAPTADGMEPEMPDWFGDFETEKWLEICDDLRRLKVLSSDCREILVAYCTAYGRWRNAMAEVDKTGLAIVEIDKNGNAVTRRNPFVAEEQAYRAAMSKLLPELGLTPASRQKLRSINPDAKKEDDPFANLMERMGRG